jgi:hypothetical protein
VYVVHLLWSDRPRTKLDMCNMCMCNMCICVVGVGICAEVARLSPRSAREATHTRPRAAHTATLLGMRAAHATTRNYSASCCASVLSNRIRTVPAAAALPHRCVCGAAAPASPTQGPLFVTVLHRPGQVIDPRSHRTGLRTLRHSSRRGSSRLCLIRRIASCAPHRYNAYSPTPPNRPHLEHYTAIAIKLEKT